MSIEIQGVQWLLRKYGQLGQMVVSENMGVAVGNAIKRVQAEAKLGCSVNHGELRNSILTSVSQVSDGYVGSCYTNKKHGVYVEFGTGPRGESDHNGISPNVAPAYTQEPWWIHESQIDRADAERYKWFYIDTPEGRFYKIEGQPAQPFMYPALKNNENKAKKDIASFLLKRLKEIANDQR
ncbi:HK97-gp10 family putative phage morphogenesis protein [Hominifimenecus sp. rT4P-3]|uniref:HK97-gp10 family putative phage morphogenesis protein n=1 Tax=Hominifimenecus sp. rT4P-3 TaxID=3242979 RepID=UPI003DA34BFA